MSILLRRVPIAICAACSALLLLPACSGNDVKRSLGLKRNNPDEFQVVSRPPLSVPPVYHLRPPSDELLETDGTPADARARSLVVGAEPDGVDTQPVSDFDTDLVAETAVTPVNAGALASHGEEALLRNAGANNAKSDIRQAIHRDNLPLREAELEPKNPFFERLKKLRGDSGEPVVDAKAEAERIAQNRDEKKPLNEGEVKEIDPSKQSVLDRLF